MATRLKETGQVAYFFGHERPGAKPGPDSNMLIAHGVAAKDAAWLMGVDGPAVGIFTYLGAKHMVTGYDHLLFLAGVIFFLYRLRDVVLYVSLFTLGHSVTLLAGVLGDIRANAHLVDALIGLSVVYKGFENLGGFEKVVGSRPDTRLAVLAFGLIHGFGLATKLQDFQLPSNGLLTNMLSFNAGVELGQMMALVVMLAAFTWWRRRPGFTSSAFAANALLMACGFVLMGYQLGGYASERDAHTVTLAADSVSPINAHHDAWMGDEISFTIAPGDFVEYKYRIDKHAPMLYAWKATASVEYDFHTEPENEESSDSISFDFGATDARSGSYVAPFDGMHGWYWKNPTDAPVTLTLTSSGFYRGPTEYKSDGTRVAHQPTRGAVRH
jgi:hypothetical protein